MTLILFSVEISQAKLFQLLYHKVWSIQCKEKIPSGTSRMALWRAADVTDLFLWSSMFVLTVPLSHLGHGYNGHRRAAILGPRPENHRLGRAWQEVGRKLDPDTITGPLC